MADSSKSSKRAFSRVTNSDGTAVRDKDNADPRPKPEFSRRPAPNLAPGGSMGIRQLGDNKLVPRNDNTSQKKDRIQFRKEGKQRIEFRKPQSDLVPKKDDFKTQAGIAIDKGDPKRDLWLRGRITSMPGYSFCAKVYDEPSKLGIEGGKISKLQVNKDGQQVMNYDRGWDDKPKTAEHREALQRVRNGLGDTPKCRIVAHENMISKGDGRER